MDRFTQIAPVPRVSLSIGTHRGWSGFQVGRGCWSADRFDSCFDSRRQTKTPQNRDSAGFRHHMLAETEGFEPSIQVLAQMLP